MNLHREVVLREMTGPIPLELILQQIVDQGDATDGYQLYVLAMLSEYFQGGVQSTAAQLDGLPSLGSNATSSVTINLIKSMTGEAKVTLAMQLLAYLASAEGAGLPLPADWTNSVLLRQK